MYTRVHHAIVLISEPPQLPRPRTPVTDGGHITGTDPCFDTVKVLAVSVKCKSAPAKEGSTLNMKVSIPTASDSVLVVSVDTLA